MWGLGPPVSFCVGAVLSEKCFGGGGLVSVRKGEKGGGPPVIGYAGCLCGEGKRFRERGGGLRVGMLGQMVGRSIFFCLNLFLFIILFF